MDCYMERVSDRMGRYFYRKLSVLNFTGKGVKRAPGRKSRNAAAAEMRRAGSPPPTHNQKGFPAPMRLYMMAGGREILLIPLGIQQ